MNILEKAALGAMSLYQLYRHGGTARQIPVNGHSVPTQAFNVLGGQSHDSKVAVILLPGFGAVPNAASPGVIGKTAHEHGADFIRFFHPGLVKDFGVVTYGGMIDEAVAVAKNLPHEQLVLVGSSFGGGMVEYVTERLESEQPGRVAGIFASVSVPPPALLDLFQRQRGWEDVASGRSENLTVRAETYPAPLILSRAQVQSVELWTRKKPGKPFGGAAVIYSGKLDPVGLCRHNEIMARRMGLPPQAHEVLDCAHKVGPENLRRGLETVLRAIS